MSERMNKDRAIEVFEWWKEDNEDVLNDELYDDEQEKKDREELAQALDIIADSLQEDKFVLLQCTDGRIFVVDSKKSIDDLTSESCKKCKRIDELKEIRMENKIFTENYFKELEPYERKEKE